VFDRETAAGQVPTLFSEDLEASLRAIRANPAKARHDIQKLANHFMARETERISDCHLEKKPGT